MTKLAFLTSAALAFTGCATDGADLDIVDAGLAGVVNGQNWSFAAGHTNAFLSEGEDDFFASLYDAAFTPCGFSEPSGPHIIVAIPKAVGDYEMGLSRNMTFTDGSSGNLIATEGRIRVDEVTATTVRGGIAATYDGNNEVNGTFTITVCADE